MSRGPGRAQRRLLEALEAGPLSERTLRRRSGGGPHFARALRTLRHRGDVADVDGCITLSGDESTERTDETAAIEAAAGENASMRSNSQPLTIHCPRDLVAALDREAQRMSRPGIHVSRAAAARHALALGLGRSSEPPCTTQPPPSNGEP